MKINRKDVYRIKLGAVNDINEYGTKIETEELNTYYCIPVRNAHKKIITFNELLTGNPLVKRVYVRNECCDDDYEDMYYPYGFDKSKDTIQIGDIDVAIDQDYKTEELQEYVKSSKSAIEATFEDLEIRAIRKTCPGYSENHDMDYYNKKLYLCPLNDGEYIIVAPCTILGVTTSYRELVTERKVIKCRSDEYTDFNYLRHSNRQLMDPEIDPIDRTILATRELEDYKIDEYMDLTPEEVEAKISNFLAKKSRERIFELKPRAN